MVYKWIGLPSRVPKGCFVTSCCCLENASRVPTSATTAKTAVPNLVIERLEIMAEVYYGNGRVTSLAVVHRIQFAQTRRQLFRERAGSAAPAPVAARRTRQVHARLAPQPENILQRNHRCVRHR